MTRIAYLTDVEGMWNKLESFTRGNPEVWLEDGRLQVQEGTVFVFGGDAIDRGDAGRRVVRTLLEAKRRLGDQVVLLGGNRDINKLRLWRELQGQPLARAPEGASQAELLRWIFENTMGARTAFEFRRTELRHEGRSSDDAAVAASYLEDLGPGGELREYLRLCQLGYRQGSTLVVHGGITEESLFQVPSQGPAQGVDAWVDGLNAWYREQLQRFCDEGRSPWETPGWAQVVAYQAPVPGTRRNRASVVYGRTADALNNPLLPPARTLDALREAGVFRLMVGHTPNGDTPSVLRGNGFELVVGDTSHSRVEGAAQVAVAGHQFLARGETVLEDGARHRVDLDHSLDDPDALIGLRTRDGGWLVKGRLEDGRWLLFRYLAGYRTEQIALEEAAVRRLEPQAPGHDSPDPPPSI